MPDSVTVGLVREGGPGGLWFHDVGFYPPDPKRVHVGIWVVLKNVGFFWLQTILRHPIFWVAKINGILIVVPI